MCSAGVVQLPICPIKIVSVWEQSITAATHSQDKYGGGHVIWNLSRAELNRLWSKALWWKCFDFFESGFRSNISTEICFGGWTRENGQLVHRVLLYNHFTISLQVPAAEKHRHSMLLPPPCFTVGMVLAALSAQTLFWVIRQQTYCLCAVRVHWLGFVWFQIGRVLLRCSSVRFSNLCSSHRPDNPYCIFIHFSDSQDGDTNSIRILVKFSKMLLFIQQKTQFLNLSISYFWPVTV